MLLGRKVITNLNSMLKSRDITFPTKVHLVKAMVFPAVVWMWELNYKESWVPNNWFFWTVVLEKTLEGPLDCKEIQPVNVLNIHWKDWCWSWNSNTLASWCKELTHWKRPCCWERLKAGGEGDDRGWDGWMASPTQWTWVWVGSGTWWRNSQHELWREAWNAVVHRVANNWTWLSRLKWTKLNWYINQLHFYTF